VRESEREWKKRQILFYRPINNVVYIFVVRPFNEQGALKPRSLSCRPGRRLCQRAKTLFYTVFSRVTNHFIYKLYNIYIYIHTYR